MRAHTYLHAVCSFYFFFSPFFFLLFFIDDNLLLYRSFSIQMTHVQIHNIYIYIYKSLYLYIIVIIVLIFCLLWVVIEFSNLPRQSQLAIVSPVPVVSERSDKSNMPPSFVTPFGKNKHIIITRTCMPDAVGSDGTRSNVVAYVQSTADSISKLMIVLGHSFENFSNSQNKRQSCTESIGLRVSMARLRRVTCFGVKAQ